MQRTKERLDTLKSIENDALREYSENDAFSECSDEVQMPTHASLSDEDDSSGPTISHSAIPNMINWSLVEERYEADEVNKFRNWLAAMRNSLKNLRAREEDWQRWQNSYENVYDDIQLMFKDECFRKVLETTSIDLPDSLSKFFEVAQPMASTKLFLQKDMLYLEKAVDIEAEEVLEVETREAFDRSSLHLEDVKRQFANKLQTLFVSACAADAIAGERQRQAEDAANSRILQLKHLEIEVGMIDDRFKQKMQQMQEVSALIARIRDLTSITIQTQIDADRLNKKLNDQRAYVNKKRVQRNNTGLELEVSVEKHLLKFMDDYFFLTDEVKLRTKQETMAAQDTKEMENVKFQLISLKIYCSQLEQLEIMNRNARQRNEKQARCIEDVCEWFRDENQDVFYDADTQSVESCVKTNTLSLLVKTRAKWREGRRRMKGTSAQKIVDDRLATCKKQLEISDKRMRAATHAAGDDSCATRHAATVSETVTSWSKSAERLWGGTKPIRRRTRSQQARRMAVQPTVRKQALTRRSRSCQPILTHSALHDTTKNSPVGMHHVSDLLSRCAAILKRISSLQVSKVHHKMLLRLLVGHSVDTVFAVAEAVCIRCIRESFMDLSYEPPLSTLLEKLVRCLNILEGCLLAWGFGKRRRKILKRLSDLS